MYNELITYTFDAEEWTVDGNLTDFTQLAYPDCLSEISYGNLTITDEKNPVNCLYLNEVELGYLAIQLSFQVQQWQEGEDLEATISSIHQNFDLLFTVGKDKICHLSFVGEPEKQISMQLDTLQNQLRNFRNNIWVDMYNHYVGITAVEDYENMEADFIR